MKKILVLILMLTVFSCGVSNDKLVNNFLENIKKVQIEEAKKDVINPEVIDELSFSFKNRTQEVFFESLFNNLQYEVLSVSKREDKSDVVNVKISNIDVSKVFVKAYKQIFKSSFEGVKDIKIDEVFEGILTSNDVPKKVVISQFLIEKDEKNRNKILIRRENIDDIFGSYFSTLSNISTEGEN